MKRYDYDVWAEGMSEADDGEYVEWAHCDAMKIQLEGQIARFKNAAHSWWKVRRFLRWAYKLWCTTSHEQAGEIVELKREIAELKAMWAGMVGECHG